MDLINVLGQKDHYYLDMADDVIRGSIVTHEVCITDECYLLYG